MTDTIKMKEEDRNELRSENAVNQSNAINKSYASGNELDQNKINSKTQFFPRDKTFWFYHGSALAVLIGFQMLIYSTDEHLFTYNSIAMSISFILFTGSLLFVRTQYKNRQWFKMGMGKQILLMLFMALTMAALSTGSIALLTFPFFWETLFGEAALQKYNISFELAMIQFFLNNIIMNFLFMSVWLFIYISVTSNRRAQAAEIQSLKLQNSLKEAKLTSLTNQLNPHFLFNSLNNIRFMIHEDADSADNMVIAFSEILRYSLESGRKDKVSLEQEVNIVNRYIEIVQMQLEDRLNYQYTIDEKIQHLMIPPMSLQILVENAIKHGIENIRQASTLAVTAKFENNKLALSVENPKPKSLATPTKGTGTGLQNIRQRLQLLYGEAASLDVEETEETFKVILRLPQDGNL